MISIAAIVEGHGEVAALPILLRRMSQWQTPGAQVHVLKPIRVRRERFLNRDAEFRRHLLLAAAKCGDQGWILLLLDADDDCPARRGPAILNRARDCVPHRRVSVVLAKREYEAWFIAVAESLHEHRGFSFDPAEIPDAEGPRNAKGWMEERMASRTYRERTDQPAFSERMDLEQAFAGSRSFRKLCNEWNQQLAIA